MSDLKNKIRDIAVFTPLFVHRFATSMEIQRIENSLMSEKEVSYCERNPNSKIDFVNQYIKKHPKVAERYNRQIHEMFLRSSKLASLTEIEKAEVKTDILFCCFAYGTHVNEYVFMDFLEKNKDWKDRRKVVSETEQHIVRVCANDITHAELSDKARAYEVLKPFYKRDICVICS